MDIYDVGRYLASNNAHCHFWQIVAFMEPDDLSVYTWHLYDHDYLIKWDIDGQMLHGSHSSAAGERWDSGVFIIPRAIPGLWYSAFNVSEWHRNRKWDAVVTAWRDHEIRPLVEHYQTITNSPVRWNEPTVQRRTTRFGFGSEIEAIMFTQLCNGLD